MSPTNVSPRDIASEVLIHVGGKTNVLSNSLCMTRLRLRLHNPDSVDTSSLNSTPGVLGLAKRGSDGIEVVFGPHLVRAVYTSFVGLTGLGPSEADIVANTPMSQALHVQIGPRNEQANHPTPTSQNTDSSDDLAGLEVLMNQDTLADTNDNDSSARKLLIINGPNINMLGIREPNTYGPQGYDELLALCREAALDAGFADCLCFQSNHEGDIVDRIQDAYCIYDGIIINPGAYTHTSIAILDALKAVNIPAIEVHISKVEEREDFRQVSYVRSACFETITGQGIEGYRSAIDDMATYLGLR